LYENKTLGRSAKLVPLGTFSGQGSQVSQLFHQILIFYFNV
jgi:hypothetical protein